MFRVIWVGGGGEGGCHNDELNLWIKYAQPLNK